MKEGGCKDSFIEWEKCIEEGEKNKEDIVEKCFEVTSALKKCMEAHSDYYASILQAEKAAQDDSEKEKEKEKVQENESNDTGPEKISSYDLQLLIYILRRISVAILRDKYHIMLENMVNLLLQLNIKPAISTVLQGV
ncbi:hypothetical protein K7X08_021197 [Anisodus acutangulus]|uniref:GCK domain-containing protein n=1 Tax=Anisodus acutangulus TaxID=402998 RepID=A0A9Q1M2C2_9SOLA|nr:hypothetical protein K7X08_021197 [Anisodus acutangulus]